MWCSQAPWLQRVISTLLKNTAGGLHLHHNGVVQLIVGLGPSPERPDDCRFLLIHATHSSVGAKAGDCTSMTSGS
jgi:hypothetical protein